MCIRDSSNHVYHQYTLKVEKEKRDGLVQYLAEKNIPSMIYYPVPGHRQKVFQGMSSDVTNLDITDWLTDRVISLPIHTEFETEQLEYISKEVLNYLG